MKLETLTRGQCQLVRDWRNAEPQFLRTPYMITEGMQNNFYNDVINDRDSKHRYFAIMDEKRVNVNDTREDAKEIWEMKYKFIGMGGLTNIEWENGTAEISLIIAPEYRGQGKGMSAVECLTVYGFGSMNLNSIYGEVYNCGNVEFWEKVVAKYKGYKTNLINRKYYDGQMFGSMWFSIGGYIKG